MTRNMNLRSIAVKIVTSAMVTVMILGGTVVPKNDYTGFIEPLKLEAASDKFPSINSKLYALVDKNTLDFNPYNREPASELLYGHVTGNPQVMTVVNGRQADFKAIAAGTFSDIKGDEWYAHLIPLALYSNYANGYPDGTFKGDQAVTKGEFAQFLAANFYSQSDISRKQAVAPESEMVKKFGSKDWWAGAYDLVSASMPKTGFLVTEKGYGSSKMCRGAVAYGIAQFLFADELHTKIAQFEKGNIPYNIFPDVTKVNLDISHVGYKKRLDTEELTFSPFKTIEDGIAHPERGIAIEMYAAMILCKEKGIMSGMDSKGTSGWAQPVTRAQVLQFMAGANKYRASKI